jgi:hypothetical protein
MKVKTLPQNWEKLFVNIYGRGSLKSYRNWICIKCGQEYNAILHSGECPNCHYNSVLSNFFKKTIDTMIKAASKEKVEP